jgi:hypothetical protein
MLRSLPVVVRNDAQNVSQAAALEIMEGPRMPYPTDPAIASQRIALLLKGDHSVIPPGGLPVGKWVEVKGRMVDALPTVNHSVVTRNLNGRSDSLELGIVTSGPPKVLNSD